MMSNLAEIIPGADCWPRFQRNRSEQFEARFVMVEVQDSPSILLAGMAGSRMPIVVSHGEGRAVFQGIDAQDNAKVALRYVDNTGAVASATRSTRTVRPRHHRPHHAGWPLHDHDAAPGAHRPHGADELAPGHLGEDSPWLRMFRNARKWVG
jgi:phosphoribosylformylglycinamidine synthase